MKKIRFLFIALFMIIATINSTCLAEDRLIEDATHKNEIIKLINECLDNIDVKIKEIDKKIENTKKQEEFAYYPAIRLDIDAPMFGMTSIVDNKLRIKKDIATTDVASRYSIKDIVKNRKIRLPESYIGSIVVSTKEISIDEKMTIAQAKLTLIKTIQYLSQVNSTSDYVDTEINSIFRDYINADKKSAISEIKDRNDKLTKVLIELSDEIRVMGLLGNDVSKEKETYDKISNELYEINKVLKNSLITESELSELKKKSVAAEADVLDAQTSIQKTYENAVVNMDYSVLLENIEKQYENKYNNMKLYIDSSKKEVVDAKTKEKTTIVNYEVTSQTTLDFLDTKVKDYKAKVKKDKAENKEETTSTSNEEKRLTNAQKEERRKAKLEENKEKIDELYSEYKDVLNREYKFYTNNINMLINDCNTKMTYVVGQIESGIDVDDEIFNYTKYIYIDLPTNLNDYIDKNNLKSNLELSNLIVQLRNELKELSNVSNKVNVMYDKVVEETSES